MIFFQELGEQYVYFGPGAELFLVCSSEFRVGNGQPPKNCCATPLTRFGIRQDSFFQPRIFKRRKFRNVFCILFYLYLMNQPRNRLNPLFANCRYQDKNRSQPQKLLYYILFRYALMKLLKSFPFSRLWAQKVPPSKTRL